MTIRRAVFSLSLIIFTAAITTQVVSQDKGKSSPPVESIPPEIQKLMSPGPEHERLAKYVGEYITVTTFFEPGVPPDSPEAQPVSGAASVTAMLGGRFFLHKNVGTMMGSPYESLQYYGYNNITKKYEANWSYTNSTGMLNMTGASADDGKTIRFTGSYTDETNELTTLVVTMTHDDADHFTVELATSAGHDGPIMTTKYARKK